MMKGMVMVLTVLGAGLVMAGIVRAEPQYGADGASRSYLLRCESTDNRLRRCPLAGDVNVRLARKLSDSQCVEGQTWGQDRNSVWVTRGCRADFAANPGYDNGGSTGSGDTFRCESNDNRTHYCDAGGRNVRLVRQLSDSACVRGRSWGRDRNGVWVSQGCRGEFASVSGGQPGWGGGSAQTIRCESSDDRYRLCSARTRGRAQLLRQLSSSRCVEGQTWGANRDGVWVDKGCRGEFSVGGGGNNNGPGNGGGRTVRCESSDNRTQRCAASVRQSVQLQRQLSDDACVQDRSWGWDRSGIWVSNGCRAEFSVN